MLHFIYSIVYTLTGQQGAAARILAGLDIKVYCIFNLLISMSKMVRWPDLSVNMGVIQLEQT